MIDWKEHFLTYLKGSAYYTGATQETKHIHSRFYLESSVSYSNIPIRKYRKYKIYFKFFLLLDSN